MKTFGFRKAWFLIAAALLLAGCATPSRQEFGSSVRSMVAGQTYDPSAPATTAPASVDGEKAGLAVKAYRSSKDAGAPAASALVIPLQ